jgi:hypothetical protein
MGQNPGGPLAATRECGLETSVGIGDVVLNLPAARALVTCHGPGA